MIMKGGARLESELTRRTRIGGVLSGKNLRNLLYTVLAQEVDPPVSLG
jgi:hypothetical protein